MHTRDFWSGAHIPTDVFGVYQLGNVKGKMRKQRDSETQLCRYFSLKFLKLYEVVIKLEIPHSDFCSNT